MKKSDNLDVLLISMPFGIHFLPSLALSLLEASVKKKTFLQLLNITT